MDELLTSGRIDDALAAYDRFESDHPAIEVPADSWNQLCWFGSLHGGASVVKEACERAVSMQEDNPSYRDSRGLARALTGDSQGAIADWQYFIERQAFEESREQREGWVALLRSGKTFALTEELRTSLLGQ